MKILIIDNYDSFTFNLFHLVGAITGSDPIIARNDAISVEEIRAMNPDAAILSPGPGHPERSRDFGVCRSVITGLRIPVLGVCLGHQGLASAFGGSIRYAPEPVHGRRSAIYHDGQDLFRGIPQGFQAVRYHSLLVDDRVPGQLVVNAWTEDGLTMGIRHQTRLLRGVQFHPESILTEYGSRLVRNFLDLARKPVRSVIRLPSRGLRHGAPSGPVLPPAPLAPADPSSGGVAPQRRWRTRFVTLPFWLDPEAVFCDCYGDAPASFWLDSSLAQRGLSRFSYMGDADGPESFQVTYDASSGVVTTDRDGRHRGHDADIFQFLNSVTRERACPSDGLPFEFNGGFVGWFGYGLKHDCGYSAANPSSLPDAAFIFADRFVAFDHEERSIYLVSLQPDGGDTSDTERWFAAMENRLCSTGAAPLVRSRLRRRPVTVVPRRDAAGYLVDIETCLDEIRNGESYELCLTNTFATDTVEQPLELYRTLRRVSPTPYAAYLRIGGAAVLCSSPERFLAVARDGSVNSKPIKGTAARSSNLEEDERARRMLAGSAKDAAENLMVVDMVRHDLGRVCRLGSVTVPSLMEIESYATVHQMVTTVSGRLRVGVSAVDCVRAAFPGGSMTGAPKARTIEILDRIENGPRGIYSGSVGWLGVSGSADLNIVIRTAVVTESDTSLGVGGAIVALSDPRSELEETILKATAVLRALTLLYGLDAEAGGLQIEGVSKQAVSRLFSSRSPVDRATGAPAMVLR